MGTATRYSTLVARTADAGAGFPPLLRAMRPLQWTKNGLVLAAPLFAHRLFDGDSLARSLLATLIFCAVCSGIYLVNDVRDAAQDRLHPVKRDRPIASGEVTKRTALMIASVLLLGGIGAALALRPLFGAVVLGYVALMIAYSYGLKRLAILDVFAIAAGFILRAAAGAIVISVPISPWLYVCTMLGALFLGFGKRRNELSTLEGAAGQHRANLDSYSMPMLDQMIAIVSAAIVISYSLYTFDAPSAPDNRAMMLTIPFVLYALFRYLYLIYRQELGGSPEVLLVTDRPILACIAGWAWAVLLIIYLA